MRTKLYSVAVRDNKPLSIEFVEAETIFDAIIASQSITRVLDEHYDGDPWDQTLEALQEMFTSWDVSVCVKEVPAERRGCPGSCC